MTNLEQQIEDAFDYRGNVTITLKNDSTVEGYMYNREFSNPKLSSDQFVDVYLSENNEPKRFPIADIEKVELSGEDHAAGKSYADWLTKQETSKEKTTNQ